MGYQHSAIDPYHLQSTSPVDVHSQHSHQQAAAVSSYQALAGGYNGWQTVNDYTLIQNGYHYQVKYIMQITI